MLSKLAYVFLAGKSLLPHPAISPSSPSRRTRTACYERHS
jgi:hypothetical protein